MKHTVERRLHAASSAGFERLARIVEPDVAATHQEVRPVQIVVMDERNPARKPGIAGAPVNALKTFFAGAVGRVRLSCKNDLNRVRRSVQEPGEPVFIVKNQLGPFVFSETASKSDGERERIQKSAVSCKLSGAGESLNPALARVFAHKREKERPQGLTHLP